MSVFSHPEYDDHESVVFAADPKAGLRAIIAIHTTLPFGVAGGGCRMVPYPSEEAALTDVLRLSRAMSYKLALFDLPAGGAKAVVIADPRKDKTVALLRAVGRAVQRLGGHYVIAEDVGTTAADMQVIAEETKFVAGTQVGTGAPTAAGVVACVRAAVAERLGRGSLDGVRVAVQGLGEVGSEVCKRLGGEGARLIVADVDPRAVERVVAAVNALPVPASEILHADADVLAPCALGAVLDSESIPMLRCKVIAGSANNQLATSVDAERLAARGILFAPDFVVNAGGVISAAHGVVGADDGGDSATVEADATRISELLRAAIARAATDHVTPYEAATRMAKEKIAAWRAAA
jgi:leucine dehydrogenase